MAYLQYESSFGGVRINLDGKCRLFFEFAGDTIWPITKNVLPVGGGHPNYLVIFQNLNNR